jgi:hypothetical protein
MLNLKSEEYQMLDLAISVDQDRKLTIIVETNNGRCLKAPGWPQDSETQLVAFDPTRNFCGVVVASELASDISMLLRLVKVRGRKPDWLKRLEQYSMGA